MDIKLKKWGIILEPLAENMSCTSTLHRNLFSFKWLENCRWSL